MIWVVTFNAILCKFYLYKKKPPELLLLQEISHPESRMKPREYLTSDRPGHYQTPNSARSSYTQPMDPKENERENFAREIGRILNQARLEKEYDKLILISPSHMGGLLNSNLDKHVKDLIMNSIHKDITNYSEKQLLDFLHEHAQFADVKK